MRGASGSFLRGYPWGSVGDTDPPTHLIGDHVDRIVVGIDRSENARRALRWAVDTAERLTPSNSEAAAPVVHAVTVVPEPRHGAFGLPSGVPPEVQEARRDEHLADFEETISRAGGRTTVRVEAHVIEGEPAAELLDFLEEEDLLVLGRSALGPLRGIVLGSVAQKCAAEAPCPVVIVPPSGFDDNGGKNQ